MPAEEAPEVVPGLCPPRPPEVRDSPVPVPRAQTERQGALTPRRRQAEQPEVSPDFLDGDALLQRLSAGCSGGDPVSVVQAGKDCHLGEIDSTGNHLCAFQLLAHDSENI